MEWWQIYLLTRLDSVSCALGGICGVSLVGAIAGAMTYLTNGTPELNRYDSPEELTFKTIRHKTIILYAKRLFLTCVVVGPIAGLLSIAVPTRNDVALIFASHWASHNEEMKKLPDNVLKTINGFLENAQKKNTHE